MPSRVPSEIDGVMVPPTLTMPVSPAPLRCGSAWLAASGATELVAPESAEVNLGGFGVESTFLGEFLKKRGIEFENRPAGNIVVAIHPRPGRPVDPARAKPAEELLVTFVDARVDRDVERHDAGGILPMRDDQPLDMAGRYGNRIGA